MTVGAVSVLAHWPAGGWFSAKVPLFESVSLGGWRCAQPVRTRDFTVCECMSASWRRGSGVRGHLWPHKGAWAFHKKSCGLERGLGGDRLLLWALAWPQTMSDQHLYIPTYWHLSLAGRGVVLDICRCVTACCCSEERRLSGLGRLADFRLPSICSHSESCADQEEVRASSRGGAGAVHTLFICRPMQPQQKNTDIMMRSNISVHLDQLICSTKVCTTLETLSFHQT